MRSENFEISEMTDFQGFRKFPVFGGKNLHNSESYETPYRNTQSQIFKLFGVGLNYFSAADKTCVWRMPRHTQLFLNLGALTYTSGGILTPFAPVL